MSDIHTLTPDMPIPPVDAGDLRAAWKVFENLARTHPPKAQGIAGVSMNLISRQCSPGANALAVAMRCMLVMVLSKQPAFETWTHHAEPDAKVFEVLANVPLPNGVAGADFDDIMARLNSD